MSTAKLDKVIIEGVNVEGQKFRPSDWVERLASILSSFGEDQRLKYHTCARPCKIKGISSLIIDPSMEKSIPEAYDFIMSFAKNNQLRIQIDRRGPSKDSIKTSERRHEVDATTVIS